VGTDTITLEVKLFAMLRQRAGADTVSVELAQGATVEDLLGELSGLIGAMPVRAAVNREYSDGGTELRTGDEVALIPPVSGGSDIHVAVTGEPLSVDRLYRMVGRDAAGAIVTFSGVTREVEQLEYEAYSEMAAEKIAGILGEVLTESGALAIAAEHRVGTVPLGEPSVIVAASSGHRPEAFAAARAAIDRIKSEAPIWKQEVEGGEARWVEGTTPA
jgi:molybdopterin synthase catalytic subunit